MARAVPDAAQGRRGRALELIERVYEGDADVDSNSLEVIIGAAAPQDRRDMIETVRGRGYRLTAARRDAPRNASLSRRLLVAAAAFIAIALVVAAIAIGFVLDRFVQGQIDQRLDTQIVFLSSLLRADRTDASRLAGNADGPPFERPRRGWYWQVTGPENALRSRVARHGRSDAPETRPRHRSSTTIASRGPMDRPASEAIVRARRTARAAMTSGCIFASCR